MRLPRKFSMNQRAEFVRCREKGKARPGRYLVLSVLRAEELPHFKVGFITTKKIGKAHVRNLLRRRFRAIVQKHGERLKDGYYLVTVVRWRAPEASFEELERDWLKQAKKLGVLRNEES